MASFLDAFEYSSDDTEKQGLIVFVEKQERRIYIVYAHVDPLSEKCNWDVLSYQRLLTAKGNVWLLGISTLDHKRVEILQKIDKELHLIRHCSALASPFQLDELIQMES